MTIAYPPNSYGNLITATSGILSYWRLGEASGNYLDSMQTYSSAAGVNVTRGQAGAIAGDGDDAVRFASNGYITLGNIHDFPSQTPFSVECWVKLAASVGSGSYPTFLSKENYNVSPNAGWGFYVEGGTNRAIFTRLGTGFAQQISTAQPLSTSVFTHLVATYDGVTMRMYRNGILDWDAGSNTPAATSTQPVRIGASGGLTDYFNGWVDEVAFYNIALSQTTITSHYNKGKTAATWLYTFKDSDRIVATESRSYYLTQKSTDSGFIRSTTQTAKVVTTAFTRTDSGKINSTESCVVKQMFSGSWFEAEVMAPIASTETWTTGPAIMFLYDHTQRPLGDFVLGQDRLTGEGTFSGRLDAAELNETESTMTLAYAPSLGSTMDVAPVLMVDTTITYPVLLRRVRGFIHYAAQRYFDEDLVISMVEQRFLPMPSSGNLITDNTFAVRRPNDTLIAVGTVQVNWTTGMIVVQVYTKEYENPSLFAQYAEG